MFKVNRDIPIFQLRGGIGNQLFIYSAAQYFTRNLYQRSYLDKRYIDHQDSIQELGMEGNFLGRGNELVMSAKRHLKLNRLARTEIDFSRVIGFSDLNISVPVNSYVRGYFQNSNFAKFALEDGCFDGFRHFSKYENLNSKFREIKNSGGIMVHLRFGDFLKGSSTLGNLSPKYYKNIFESNSSFKDAPIYVMSDDYSRAQKFLAEMVGYNFIFLSDLTSHKNVDQFFLFGATETLICANSTFSWWGGFLSKEAKNVYVPKPWFKSEELQMQMKDSFYPNSFITAPSVWV